MSQEQRCKEFSALHKLDDAWIIPNPWDIGTAKLLQGQGFKALATTSSGFAFSLGRVDGEVSLEEKLEHCKSLVQAVEIPINADFENGFSDSILEMKSNIKRLIETGIAGLSIEDYSRDKKVLYSISESVDRIAAAQEAIEESGVPVVLTVRAENLIRSVDDLDDTVLRLQAYGKAGGDVLYAPGIKTLELLQEVTSSVEKPFNVLGVFMPDATLEDFSAAGATRVSVGGALCWSALNTLISANQSMASDGSFLWAKQLADSKLIRQLMSNS